MYSTSQLEFKKNTRTCFGNSSHITQQRHRFCEHPENGTPPLCSTHPRTRYSLARKCPEEQVEQPAECVRLLTAPQIFFPFKRNLYQDKSKMEITITLTHNRCTTKFYININGQFCTFLLS